MRKKKAKRNKNLLSYMSCNYDQTKLRRPLLEHYHASARYLTAGRWVVWMFSTCRGVPYTPVAGFRSMRRARRLVEALNAYLAAHSLISHA